jgi:phage gp16-like protein
VKTENSPSGAQEPLEPAAKRRASLVRLIHVAQGDLAKRRPFDEDDYRALLARTTGKTSCDDLDVPELEKVMKAFRALGFRVRHKKRAVGTPPPQPSNRKRSLQRDPSPGVPGEGVSRPLDQWPMASKLRALWLELHALGEVRDPNESALCSWAANHRSPKVTTDLHLLSAEQIDRAIERAKQWRLRVLMEGEFFCDACDWYWTKAKGAEFMEKLARGFPGKCCPECIAAFRLEWRRTET